ncbi:MAG: phosphoglycerate dehydrogenase related dehydrogenase [uncultured archaeon A07HR60]|jgi:Phosphoglycerate dehydrogenase and related dehydrogenases|nr:MAG: phosphoglycerate dehydrogenase related dehydrogenase [Halorubrum sp. J07HR59]ESS12570.1 MAG: phosphoglycerate dehydrogenase related dehydrogenase [uncultured archaeon A07HR60]
MTQSILVSDNDFPDLSVERELVSDVDVEIIEAQAHDEREVVEAVSDAEPDAILGQYAPITREAMEAVPDLRAIGRYGIGVDTIDIEAATEHGVVAINVPDYCVDEVPTHAMALILSVERRTAFYTDEIASGNWDFKSGQPIYRLRGRTLGLAGFGKLPRHLVEKATAFGLDPIAYDPYVDATDMAEYGVEKVSFQELLEQSDVISVHTPLTDETRNLFGADAFTTMDNDATIINTSRGPVIDVTALYDAIVDGELRGAGLDVMPEEPPTEEHPLFSLDETVMTPHVAWHSEESFVQLRRTICEDLLRVLRDDSPENPVNDVTV